MRYALFIVLGMLVFSCSNDDTSGNDNTTPPSNNNYYYPTQTSWATTDPADLGWDIQYLDSLDSFHENALSESFIILKGGKIVYEKYYNGASVTKKHLWNSASKSLTATLVGIAQDEGMLSIDDKSSDYLGTGWTNTPIAKENLITIKNQLSMTAGLDDNADNCLEPSCLLYLADAGTRWSYHNGPYTLLSNVVENASDMTFNEFTDQYVDNIIGMTGTWVTFPPNTIYYSVPRDMARFGSMILSGGKWNNLDVIKDKDYLQAAIQSSQNINKAYGYLWWLNGQSSGMVPGSQIVFPTSLVPQAPADMYSAIGKDGQIIDIVPSLDMVVVRTGDFNANTTVSFTLQRTYWEYILRMIP